MKYDSYWNNQLDLPFYDYLLTQVPFFWVFLEDKQEERKSMFQFSSSVLQENRVPIQTIII